MAVQPIGNADKQSMSVPRLYRQGVDMGRGALSTVKRWLLGRDWLRLIILGVGLAVIAGQMGCQSSTSIKGAKSEASATSSSSKLRISTGEVKPPAPVKVRVKVRESK